MMPEIDGIELARPFRQDAGKAETPLLMVTASTDRKVRYEALQLGVNDFLDKPIIPCACARSSSPASATTPLAPTPDLEGLACTRRRATRIQRLSALFYFVLCGLRDRSFQR